MNPLMTQNGSHVFCASATFWPPVSVSWPLAWGFRHCQSYQSIKKSSGSIVWFMLKSLALLCCRFPSFSVRSSHFNWLGIGSMLALCLVFAPCARLHLDLDWDIRLYSRRHAFDSISQWRKHMLRALMGIYLRWNKLGSVLQLATVIC